MSCFLSSFELHICGEKNKGKDGISLFDSSDGDEGRALRHTRVVVTYISHLIYFYFFLRGNYPGF